MPPTLQIPERIPNSDHDSYNNNWPSRGATTPLGNINTRDGVGLGGSSKCQLESIDLEAASDWGKGGNMYVKARVLYIEGRPTTTTCGVSQPHILCVCNAFKANNLNAEIQGAPHRPHSLPLSVDHTLQHPDNAIKASGIIQPQTCQHSP